MRVIALLFLLLCLNACKSTHCINSYDKNYKGSVKVGNPYSVNDVTYTPKLDIHYDQVGLASWYGYKFHCLKTANGEYFDKHQLSAAHKTLPMPSVARVTNLANNRSVEVIINDRGPFIKGRIIDLSENAAIALDMKHHGVAKVRVQFLQNETNKLMAEIAANKKIYYDKKPKHKYEIIVAQYAMEKQALQTMRKIAKLGKVHTIASKRMFEVALVAKNKSDVELLLKKLKNMGYKNAKISN